MKEEFNYAEFVADDFKLMRDLMYWMENESKKHDPKIAWEYIRSMKLKIQSTYQGFVDYRNGMVKDGEDLLNQLGL